MSVAEECLRDYEEYVRDREKPREFVLHRCGPIDRMTLTVRGVYLAQCQSFIKIGHAKNISKRMYGISVANPHRVTLLAYIPALDFQDALTIERQLHQRFAADRYRLEWFHYTDRIRRFIEEMAHVEGAPPRS